ncbi:TCP-1_chaperonin subunit theta [Hexamita inflata]|nr:TCP-1 chaperonin subunit theta [Hexamita inflata]
MWAFRSAVDAACSILRVDQVVMRKQAGGPGQKEKGQQEWN